MSKSILITAAAMTALLAVRPTAPAPGSQRMEESVCNGAIQHPLSARVTPLDPIRRGEVVRVQVDIASDAAFEEVRVRLADAGGAMALGVPSRSLGAMPAGGKGSSEFAVRVPEKGLRALLQFTIQGDGPAGLITRGATFNILPDGPADPGRPATRFDGTSIREYAAKGVR